MKTFSKVLLALISILVLPCMFFLPILQVNMSGSIFNMESLGLKEYNSIYSVITAATNEDSGLGSYIKLFKEAKTNGTLTLKDILPTIDWMYVALAMAVLVLVFALLAFFFSIFSNKKWLIAGFSVGGILSGSLFKTFFGKFAEPLLNGTVSVTTIFSQISSASQAASSSDSTDLSGTLSELADTLSESLGINLSGLADSLVGFKTLAVSYANTASMLLFASVIILCIVFIVSAKNDSESTLQH